MRYQKINNILGWVAFAIALVTYSFTVEPTASYWDCGEFISCAFKLEVPHPPGAPFFLLVGRFFSMIAGDDVTMVAFWVNMLSVLSSSFFILFIFWSITHMIKKALKLENGKEKLSDTILVMGGGLAGALSCTFLDSFWYSAVEGEIYAFSAFFTGFVIWAILKWENVQDPSRGARWLILIAYMMGLSIGVHLLNLVAIPFLAFIVYFKFYQPTLKGILATFAISAFILLFIMEGIITGFASLAGFFEVLFVNSFGMPFGSGMIFFILVIIGALIYGIIYTIKRQNYVLNTVLLSLTFILVGYSSYTIVPIRSSYNPPIDENNPEEVMSLVSYLKREQYGNRPLFRGAYYTAKLVENVKGAPVYKKGEGKYIVKDYKIDQKYDPDHTTIFPRMYHNSQGGDVKYLEITGLKKGERPSFSDNIHYFIEHQLGFQYFRYFMWNFVGRESDIKGASWVGINALFEKVPSIFKENKGRNIYLGIPLIIGLLGMFVQYKRNKKMFMTSALLFFLTGIALVIYLNPAPIEPRERDYIFAGSFYMFTFWIGFGVVAIFELLISLLKNRTTAAVVAGVIGLCVPAILLSQNLDDHDRSGRYFSVDSAKNYLASCAPNAILFTGGDNDTFPLWYAQEVEGFRTDVRVIVLSYFNTDWYIQQMMRDAYQSDSLPFSLSSRHYDQGGLNDYLPVVERQELKGKAVNAEILLRLIKSENKGLQIPTSISAYNSVPGKTLFIGNVDTTKVQSMLPDYLKDKVVDKMILNIKGNALEKKDLAFLDLLVTSKWNRPIYVNNTSIAQLNLDITKYLVQEGVAFRVLPVASNTGETFVNREVMYENVMNKFRWTGLDDPDIYYTQDYKGFVLNFRSVFNALANSYIQIGDFETARQVITKSLKVMPNDPIPYDVFNARQVPMLLNVGALNLANQVADNLANTAQEVLEYYEANPNKVDMLSFQRNVVMLNELAIAYANQPADSLNREQIYRSLFDTHFAKFQQLRE